VAPCELYDVVGEVDEVNKPITLAEEYLNLRERAVSGVKWNAISQFTGQGITIICSIILSRILSPSLFGLFAMIAVLGNLINLIIGMGFNHAVIQNRTLTRKDLDSFFWLNIIVGSVTSALFYFLAPVITAFYGQPELLHVAQVFSIVFIIASATIVPGALLAKDLRFKKLATSNILAFLVSYGGALVLGYYSFGVWALVFQYIAFQVVTLSFNLIFASWWPAFTLQRHSLKKITKFVSRFLPTQILDYFTSNIDLMLVGKFFGKNELGIYGRAQGIIMMPVNSLSILLSKSFFSIFSILQEDASKLRSNFVSSAKLLMITISPLLIAIALVPGDFVVIVFGDQWLEMSPLLPVLCAAGILGSFNALNDGLYTALGRADILLRVVVIEKIALVVMIIAGMFFGLLGIAYARLAAQVFSFVLRVHQQKKVIDVSFMFWARSFMKIIFAGMVMIVAVVLLQSSLADFSLTFRFPIVVSIAIMSFFICLLLLREEIVFKLRDTLYGFGRKKM